MKQWFATALALVSGLAIGWIDTRPGWDDTGITVGLILITSAILGFAFPKRCWIRAIIIGGALPLFNIMTNGNYGSLIALVIAFLGSYSGAGLRTLISGAEPGKESHRL